MTTSANGAGGLNADNKSNETAVSGPTSVNSISSNGNNAIQSLKNNGSNNTTTILGITPPISLEPPTAEELESTEQLIKALQEMNIFEKEEETIRREGVLKRLNLLIREFVRQTIRKRHPDCNQYILDNAGGKIFTFGSYRLGAHSAGTLIIDDFHHHITLKPNAHFITYAGSDIDALCVVPKFVQREDFFTTFYEMLTLMKDEVSDVTAVPDSYVPVMKMSLDGIPIDLVFARLSVDSVPDDLELRDEHLLKTLDERCVRSLNGTRVSDELLRLVPNVPTFRVALRCVKLWAKKRAIYSNVLGFLGGVAWAMMVARVCQLYPNATACTVVSKFFRIMGQWPWPQPVLLKPIDDGPLPVRVWNPRIFPADRAHRMPVITPAYPSMCATHNVTSSTLKIMMDELNRAADMTDIIMIKSANWKDLFTKHDFFHRYKYYLQVIASSDSIDNQRIWSALVESRLRHLVLKLEFVENLVLAHPFVHGYDHNVNCYSEQQAIDAGRGIFHDLSQFQPSFVQHAPGVAERTARTVYTTTFYIGLAIEPRPLGVTAPRKLDISWPTSDFTKMCKQWEKYDERSMGICVKYIKSTLLPNNVFDEGEPRGRLKREKQQRQLQQPQQQQNNQPLTQSTAVSTTNPTPILPFTLNSTHPFKKRRSVTAVDDSNGSLQSSTSLLVETDHGLQQPQHQDGQDSPDVISV